ncbi:hypothetical protein [Bacillus sp. B15-48]|uniref:hypothetical protein n=1 Tax=Bacillus sp. B15-48 TaxID=1548601 RepID=UPI00193F520B|nr:hypothetical protein [Bacillus sp. B15-48]MBM4761638.1 hypothetical protein [Bacillus sp. B15-48]
MRTYLLLAMCALFLIQYFVGAQWLQYFVVSLALLAFISSAGKADRFPRLLGFLMMSTGMIIEWGKGTGFNGINQGIYLIIPLICLITLAPLLSIPLKVSGFFQAISQLLRKLLDHPKKLYAGITGSLFFLSPIFNLASVRMISEFLEDLKLPSAMSAKSYLVGFTTALLWSPYFASVSLVLHYLNIPYSEYILYGLGLSILSLLIGNLLFALWEKHHPLTMDKESKEVLHENHRKQLIQLSLIVVFLMGVCLLIEVLTHWSMVVIVCLLSITIPLLYGLKRANRKPMIPLFAAYRNRTLPLMNNEIMLFMSAGMLAYALQGTKIAIAIGMFLTNLSNISFFLFAFAVLAIVLCITYVGIHQIAVIGALSMQLNAAELGMTNLGLAMLLLLAWALSASLSPFSGLNLMVSRIAGISGVRVGLRANGLHIALFAVIGITIISFIA